MKLFIGCSSSNDIPQIYNTDCKHYLEELFKLDNDLVFGAYNKGLMSISYNIALNNNREIIGITPKIFEEALEDLNCTKEIITKDINDRTKKLIEESDALIFLPGGIGTIYELFTTIESKRSGEFNKPIIIYNSNNYFDKLFLFLDEIYGQNFTSPSVKECYHISYNSKDTIDYLNRYFDWQLYTINGIIQYQRGETQIWNAPLIYGMAKNITILVIA